MALLAEIDETARRGDDDVDAAAELIDLPALRDTAADHDVPEIRLAAVARDLLPDLDRKLARGREDEAMRRAGAVAGRSAEALEHRQHESGRLAGAGLGDAENVLASEQDRNSLRLDRCGGVVLGGGERAQERLGDAECCKSRSRHEVISLLHPKKGSRATSRAQLTGRVLSAPCACGKDD